MAGRRLDSDASTVGLDEPACDREPEARSRALAGAGKGIEDAVELIRRDALPAIGDLHGHAGPCAANEWAAEIR